MQYLDAALSNEDDFDALLSGAALLRTVAKPTLDALEEVRLNRVTVVNFGCISTTLSAMLPFRIRELKNLDEAMWEAFHGSVAR